MPAFLKNLIACYVATICHANLCFDGSKLPKVLAGKRFSNNSQYSAIVGDTDSIYFGGMTADQDISGSVSNVAVVTRLEIGTLAVIWSMCYSHEANFKHTTGLALRDARLAVHVQDSSSSEIEEGGLKSYLFIVNTSTGMQVTKNFEIVHGISSEDRWRLHSESMFMKPNYIVFLAFELVGANKRETPDNNQPYADRQKLVKVDADTETIISNVEQKDWFGRSTVYQYNESNELIYLGGSLDPIHIQSTNDVQWSPFVQVLNSWVFNVDQVCRLKLGSSYETDETDHSVIDHMSIDPIDEDFLFGTTRGSKVGEEGTRVYIWRVELQGDGTIDDNDLDVRKFDQSFFGGSTQTTVTGISSHLANGYNRLHAVFFIPETSSLYYCIANFQGATTTEAVKIGYMERARETFFQSTQTSETFGGVGMYEAYTVGWARQMTGTSQIQAGSLHFGLVQPSWQSITCSTDHLDFFGDPEQLTFELIPVSGGNVEQITFVEWGYFELSSPNSSITAGLNQIEQWNLAIDQLISDSWCSTYTPVTSSAFHPTFTWTDCNLWQTSTSTVSFDPVQINSPTCTDTGNIWTYWLTTTSVLPQEFKIAIDGILNVIVVEIETNASAVTTTYDFTAHAMAPIGQSNGEQACEGHGYDQVTCLSVGCCQYGTQCSTAIGTDDCPQIKNTFDFSVEVQQDCSSATLIRDPNSLPPQTYFIGDPGSGLEIAPWTSSNLSCIPSYTASAVSAGQLYPYASGLGMKWCQPVYSESNCFNVLNIDDVYSIQVTAGLYDGGCGTPVVVEDSRNYQLTVLANPCTDAVIKIVDQVPNMGYVLGQKDAVFTFGSLSTPSYSYSTSPPGADCGDFSYTESTSWLIKSSLSANQMTFTIEKSDTMSIGSYSTDMTIGLENWPAAFEITNIFEINIYKLVHETTFSVNDHTYTIGSGTLQIIVEQIELSPEPDPTVTFGPYAATMSDGTSLPQELITFNASTMTFTVNSDNSITVNDYDVVITAETLGGDLNGQSLTTSFRLSVVEPALPYFAEELQAQEIWVGDPWVYILPEVLHDDDLMVTFDVDLGILHQLVSFEDLEGVQTLELEEGITQSSDAGLYFIQITLVDEIGNQSDPYFFSVAIVDVVYLEEVSEVQIDDDANTKITSEDAPDIALEELDSSVEIAVQWAEELKGRFKDIEFEKPTVTIKHITMKGEIELYFPNTMYVPADFSMIRGNSDPIFRKLQDTAEKQDETQQTLEITIVKKEEEEQSSNRNLDFSWEVTSFTKHLVHIQCHFVESVYISSDFEPDILRIKFVDSAMFFDFAGQSIESGTKVERPLPPQIQLNTYQEQLTEVIEVVENGTKLILSSNLILNFFFVASLQQLWQLIHTQQIIILIPLFRVTLPANIAAVFNLLMKIAAFDMINTDGIYDTILDLPPSKPLSPNFEAVGFESIFLIYNMGSITLIIMIIPFMMLFVWALTFVPKRFQKNHQFWFKLERKLYWNTLIRLMMESFLVLLLCCMINTSHLKWTSVSLAINSTLVIVIAATLFGSPIVILRILNRYFYQLENLHFRARYETAYYGLNFKKGKMILVHISMFYLRRFLLAGCAVYFTDNLAIQVAFLYLTTLLEIAILIGLKVFKDNARNREEALNEVIAFLIMYSVFLFTDYVSNVNVKFILGYLFSVFILAHLTYNIIIIIRRNISLGAKRRFIKNELKRKEQRSLALREARQMPFCKVYAENRRKAIVRQAKLLEEMKRRKLLGLDKISASGSNSSSVSESSKSEESKTQQKEVPSLLHIASFNEKDPYANLSLSNDPYAYMRPDIAQKEDNIDQLVEEFAETTAYREKLDAKPSILSFIKPIVGNSKKVTPTEEEKLNEYNIVTEDSKTVAKPTFQSIMAQTLKRKGLVAKTVYDETSHGQLEMNEDEIETYIDLTSFQHNDASPSGVIQSRLPNQTPTKPPRTYQSLIKDTLERQRLAKKKKQRDKSSPDKFKSLETAKLSQDKQLSQSPITFQSLMQKTLKRKQMQAKPMLSNKDNRVVLELMSISKSLGKDTFIPSDKLPIQTQQRANGQYFQDEESETTPSNKILPLQSIIIDGFDISKELSKLNPKAQQRQEQRKRFQMNAEEFKEFD